MGEGEEYWKNMSGGGGEYTGHINTISHNIQCHTLQKTCWVAPGGPVCYISE